MGKTFRLDATANLAQLSINSDSTVCNYFLHNTQGTADVFVRISQSSTANVAVPNNASGAYGFVVHGASYCVITGPPVGPNANVFVTVIAPTGTPTLYITPGEGIL